MSLRILLKRVYDAPIDDDGYRVLIDRLWPRGLRKEAVAADAWAKDLAPSTALRQWFDHDPARFDEFGERYRRELAEQCEALDDLLVAANGETLTLVYAASDPVHNHSHVLRDVLLERA